MNNNNADDQFKGQKKNTRFNLTQTDITFKFG